MPSDKFGRLIEKFVDHPDGDRIIAHEMGWTWIEEALDAEAKRDASETGDGQDSDPAADPDDAAGERGDQGGA